MSFYLVLGYELLPSIASLVSSLFWYNEAQCCSWSSVNRGLWRSFSTKPWFWHSWCWLPLTGICMVALNLTLCITWVSWVGILNAPKSTISLKYLESPILLFLLFVWGRLVEYDAVSHYESLTYMSWTIFLRNIVTHVMTMYIIVSQSAYFCSKIKLLLMCKICMGIENMRK